MCRRPLTSSPRTGNTRGSWHNSRCSNESASAPAPLKKVRIMRERVTFIIATAAIVIAGAMLSAQFQFDPDRVVPGGGVFVSGWTGKIDQSSVRQGRSLNDSKLAQEGGGRPGVRGAARHR